MNTKFLKLAQSFAAAIQDSLHYDSINDDIIFGQLLTQESDYQNYLQRAMETYFQNLIKAVEYRPEKLVIINPNLLNYIDITLNNTGKTAHNRKNIWKLLSAADLEAVDNSFLPYIQSDSGYFRSKTTIVFDDEYIYYLPKPVNNINRRIYYVRLPLQNDGEYFGFNSVEDICFDEQDFQQIIEIAIKLYRIDDYQEDV